MKRRKWFATMSAGGGVLATLLSCALTVPPVVDIPPTPYQAFQFDTGMASKGATLRLQFRLAPKPDFTTLQCTIDDDLDHFRVFLINASAGITPADDLATLPNQVAGGTFYTVSKSGLTSPSGSQSVLLNNVTAGTWAVAIAPYDSGGTNISAVLADNTITSPLTGNVFVSKAGGQGDGTVVVGAAPNYTVTGTDALVVTVELNSVLGCLI